ncbi:DUF732 domain-containing protein [Mycobacterium sp. E1715]|uniref:DUF732 domain-containing protein n=1 Tax=Mycobacterium sp. E1715 TaxID=1856863 RepID=UPI0012E9CD00|nr:DUF732 domain-containing protein [Mycobacterium sp. E1715]
MIALMVVTFLVIAGVVVAVVAGVMIHRQQSNDLKAQWAPPAAAMIHYSAAEQMYLDHLRNVQDPNTRERVYSGNEADALRIVNTGHMVCYDLGNGVGMGAEIVGLQLKGYSPLASHAIVNLAFTDLCPRVYG